MHCFLLFFPGRSQKLGFGQSSESSARCAAGSSEMLFILPPQKNLQQLLGTAATVGTEATVDHLLIFLILCFSKGNTKSSIA